MGRSVSGDVVVIPFPFSDLSSSKRRPALVVAAPAGDDVVLCQITSRATSGPYAKALDAADFADGGLSVPSNIRPEKLFTADSAIAVYRAGKVTPTKLAEVVASIVALLGS